MMQEETKHKLLLLLAFLGLTFATLAGLSEHVKWLQAICSGFSDGCRETAEFTLFRLPLWLWGVGYFALLVVLVMTRRPRRWLTWIVAGGVGIEIGLIWVMISMNIVCVYCLGNLLAIVLLAFMTFERSRFWQTLSICLLFFMFSAYTIPHENELHASIGEKEDKSDIAATVAGQVITESQLEAPLASQIHDLQRQIYQMKRQRLDEMIAEILLQKEAGGRGISPQKLLNDELFSKGINVSDAEVEAYYQENRGRMTEWKGSQEELKSRIRATLQQQKGYQKVLEYTRSLESKYGVVIQLKEPQPLHTKVNIEGSPSMGPSDAPVVVVEFSDYECPACRAVHDTVRKVREMYAGRIRWVFKDFPLKRHEHADKAAEAARCAAEQGKFWEYQDALYSSKEALTPDSFVRYAKDLGLASERFNQCLESGKYSAAIEKEKQDAKLAGVDRTPTFIINGKLFTGGMALERFKEIIDKELSSSKPKG